jgi:phosphatidylserine synthase
MATTVIIFAAIGGLIGSVAAIEEDGGAGLIGVFLGTPIFAGAGALVGLCLYGGGWFFVHHIVVACILALLAIAMVAFVGIYRRRHPKKVVEIPTDPTTVMSQQNGSIPDWDDEARYGPRDYYRDEDDE